MVSWALERSSELGPVRMEVKSPTSLGSHATGTYCTVPNLVVGYHATEAGFHQRWINRDLS
jgi:hypothetical protein